MWRLPAIGSLTVTGGTTGTTTLKMTSGDTLTASGSITLSNARSIIDGAGTISASGAIGSSGTIAAGVAGSRGGTLELTAPLSRQSHAGSDARGVVMRCLAGAHRAPHGYVKSGTGRLNADERLAAQAAAA
jgi:hypothetical protein